MSLSFERVEWLDAGPDIVWSTLVDLSKASLWMKGIKRVRPMDDSPLAVGKTYEIVVVNDHHEAIREMTVSALEVRKYLTLSSKAGGVSADYTYRLEPHKNGTLLELQVHCSAKTLLWKLAKPLISLMLARHDGYHLRDFRNAFEAGAFTNKGKQPFQRQRIPGLQQ